ncbi:hypothetical protein EYR40_010072 [Pleurotus pulmonarius]|nr:hypothetical protein EYR36_010532 [Pleurotus pulmonarius]KAF4588520.1 hypothetical protein EYR40_010072 [Pleurotus pulmonarius]
MSTLAPSGSSSSSIATGTATTTATSSSTFSSPPASTFAPDPTPSPTFGPPPNNNPTPGIATSASLYLYTFLATLVLLLGVSSAIVVRSLILRRRHRRMIEEAIRNGTWVPPAASSPRRVDLSKKPKMYEAWISRGDAQDRRGLEHTDWEGIMPFSVLYTLPSKPAAGTPQASSSTNNTAPVSTPNPDAGAPSSTGRSRLSRFTPLRLFRRPAAPAASPSPSAPANPAGDAAGVSNAAGNNGSASSNEKQPVTQADGRKSKVQVAVLIAMPDASSSNYYNNKTRPSTPSQSISSTSNSLPLSSTPLASTPPPTSRDGEEEELPAIEVGVAQVTILGGDEEEGIIDDTSRGAKRSIGSVSEPEHRRDSGSRSSNLRIADL